MSAEYGSTGGTGALTNGSRVPDDAARLSPDDTFRFGCHPGVPCFNACCNDVTIFLSPYDILRLKRRLGLSSSEFLDRHVLLPVQKDMRTPVVVLRMRDDSTKSCPFLTASGCGVYEDRPWPCRMYPLGLAAQKDTPDGWRGERHYFLLREEVCRGFDESAEWTVRSWMEKQGVDPYEEWGEAFKELALHEFFEQGGVLSPEKMEMFYTATFDLDRFRSFVFNTSFLDKFEVDDDLVQEMRYSDEAMLRMGFLWLRYSLFGEDTVRIRDDVAQAYREALQKRTLHDRKRVQPAGAAS